MRQQRGMGQGRQASLHSRKGPPGGAIVDVNSSEGKEYHLSPGRNTETPHTKKLTQEFYWEEHGWVVASAQERSSRELSRRWGLYRISRGKGGWAFQSSVGLVDYCDLILGWS